MPLVSPGAMTTGRTMTLLDAAGIALTWPLALATGIAAPAPAGAGQMLLLAVVYPGCGLALLYAMGLYRRDSLLDTQKTLRRLPVVATLSAIAGSLCVLLLEWPLHPLIGAPPHPGRLLLSAAVCFLLGGVAARAAFVLLRRRGSIGRRLLVVGAGKRAWDLAWLLKNEGRHLQYTVWFAHKPAFGDIDPRLADGSEGTIIHVAEQDLLQTARCTKADMIIMAPDERRGMTLVELLACKTAGFPIKEYLSFIETELRRVDLKRLEVGWLLYSEGFTFGTLDRLLKRGLDILVSLALLIPATPLLLLAAVAITIDDGGPLLYRQTRISQGGRSFSMMKLRTMRVDAESAGAVWAAMADSRITRIGSVLRRTRLDELPQLLNVLRGDMSLVGPRPERPEFVAMLAREIPLYGERHLVKAGLTGWAQVNYQYGASVDDARSKLSYDLYYVKNFSLWFDLLILMQTARVLVWPGATVR